MSYPIKYPTPQSANVQTFNYSTNTTSAGGANQANATWVKPKGASFVYFCLIGSGGAGGNSDPGIPAGGAGGGSGAVTNFMCPAFLIPDTLVVKVGRGGLSTDSGTTTQVGYQQKSGGYYPLLTADTGGTGTTGGGGGAGGTAMADNNFTAMGFLNSTAGQAGAPDGSNVSASTTTFLGGGSSGNIATGNYDYSIIANAGQGYFQTQPIIVGVGGTYQVANFGTPKRTAIGCGGGGGSAASNIEGGTGGHGMVVIITW